MLPIPPSPTAGTVHQRSEMLGSLLAFSALCRLPRDLPVLGVLILMPLIGHSYQLYTIIDLKT